MVGRIVVGVHQSVMSGGCVVGPRAIRDRTLRKQRPVVGVLVGEPVFHFGEEKWKVTGCPIVLWRRLFCDGVVGFICLGGCGARHWSCSG